MPIANIVDKINIDLKKDEPELFHNKGEYTNELGIFLIKPDGMNKNVGGISFQYIVQDLFKTLYLNIEQDKTFFLNSKDLPKLFPPLIRPCNYGGIRKDEFVRHMTSNKIRCFLLSGERTQEKLYKLKMKLRKELIDNFDRRNKVVYNLVHTVDEEDFDISYKILFSDEKS